MTLADAVLRFSLLAVVVAITPGLDTILVLRQALRGRRTVAFAAAAGIGLGALGWGVGAAAGLAALFVASQVAYNVLRWAGVAFLLYLGWGYLRSAARGQTHLIDASTPAADSVREAFVKGLLTDLLNPKMAIFYLTVLPLFLPPGYSPVMVGTLLAGLHAAIAMVWFTIVIFGAHAVRRFLDTRRGARVVDGFAGVAMVGFGLALGMGR